MFGAPVKTAVPRRTVPDAVTESLPRLQLPGAQSRIYQPVAGLPCCRIASQAALSITVAPTRESVVTVSLRRMAPSTRATTGETKAYMPARDEPTIRAEHAHAELLTLREALRAILRAEVENIPIGPVAASAFERAVAAAFACRNFSAAEAPFGWRWLPDDLAAVQHRVILSAADLLADTTRRPVSVCAGPDCDWYFLDTSKSGNRRWCSDAGCGTASRVRRLRHRRTAECGR